MVTKLSATIHGASSTHRTTTPDNVLDGNPDSAWNSGTHPVGWITLDLGKPCILTKVRLLPEMTPKICHVIHKVKVGYESDKLKTIWTLDAECKSQEWIEMDAPSGTVARYVQIYTEESSSWLSWRLIEAYGSPAGHIAIYMGHHSRLGKDSPLFQLDELLMAKITNLAFGCAEISPLSNVVAEADAAAPVASEPDAQRLNVLNAALARMERSGQVQDGGPT